MKRPAAYLWAAAALAWAGAAPAQDAVFDFEDKEPGGTNFSAVGSTVNGISLTVDRPVSAFKLVSIGPLGGPAAFGDTSLSPFNDFSDPTSATPFRFSFSAALSGLSLAFGDFGEDADTLTITGYSGANATGDVVFTTGGALAGGGRAFIGGSAGVAGVGPFRSVTVIGGSPSFPNSVYLDNVAVTLFADAVPEPAAWAMMILGFGAVGHRLRRRRARVRLAAA